MGEQKEYPTKNSIGDIVDSTVKASLSLIPILSGPASELFQKIITPPLEKRRITWLKNLSERISELENKGLKIEDLKNNQMFISVVMISTQSVIKNHQKEKIEALKNAVINTALKQNYEETKVFMFLSFIDSLSAMHLKILKLFQSPYSTRTSGSLKNIIEDNVKELVGKKELSKQLWKDLLSRGLVNTEGILTTMSENGLLEKRTTEFGDEFLRFIQYND